MKTDIGYGHTWVLGKEGWYMAAWVADEKMILYCMNHGLLVQISMSEPD